MANLKVAWTYRTGDAAEGSGSTIECTPIVAEGTMYLTTVRMKIVALDPASGAVKWEFETKAPGVNRGVAFWSDGRAGGERRILAALSDGKMYSLDAKTGKLDPAFGRGGILDLRIGLDWDVTGHSYGSSSAPAIYENLVMFGALGSEGHPGAPGDVRAFDVRTGREVWRFHTVPRPGEPYAETWPDGAWKGRSGANPWSGLTVDTKNGIVFCATGSAGSDFYGKDRAGDNLFANCVLALDARTGKRLWHFQTVHHDLWDHDNPTPPILVTIRRGRETVEGVAQLTKTGFCYLFERTSGKPLFPVREVKAPPSSLVGEVASPTQPEPVKPPPFARQVFTDAEVTDISPEAASYVREQLKKLRYGKRFEPPSEEGTVVTPGFHGGATWSGGSFDPETGLLYVNSNNAPYLCRMKKNASGGYDFQGYQYFNDAEGYPAMKPPWGLLTAIDVSKGSFTWQKVLGEFPELKARGVPQTGTENFGGTIVTAGGLVFIGGTKDEKFRAFDKATGKILWETNLPAGGYATPCTYMANGKQYVVIACGGGGKLRTKSGDQYVAFALL